MSSLMRQNPPQVSSVLSGRKGTLSSRVKMGVNCFLGESNPRNPKGAPRVNAGIGTQTSSVPNRHSVELPLLSPWHDFFLSVLLTSVIITVFM